MRVALSWPASPSVAHSPANWLTGGLASGDRHQGVQTLWRLAQVPARSGEHDHAAIEDDRVLGEFECQLRMLLDQQQRQIVLALQAFEPGEQTIDDHWSQAFER